MVFCNNGCCYYCYWPCCHHSYAFLNHVSSFPPQNGVCECTREDGNKFSRENRLSVEPFLGTFLTIIWKTSWVLTSARSSYSKLKYSMSFNPQNLNSAKLKPKKSWKTCITSAKTRNTKAKFELDTCSNSTFWNSKVWMKNPAIVVSITMQSN